MSDKTQTKPEAETEKLWVVSGRKDGRTALFERHPDHPKANPGDTEGEVFIPGTKNRPVEVARTTQVGMKLVNGDLRQVDAPKEKAPAGPTTPASSTAPADGTGGTGSTGPKQ